MRIRLGKEITQERGVQTGEALLCENCGACFTDISVYDGHKNQWKCEFCGNVNEGVFLEEEEIPKDCKSGVEYIIEAVEKKESLDEQLVVICLDLSGSMCVTHEIPELQSKWRGVRQVYADKEELAAEQSQYSSAARMRQEMEAIFDSDDEIDLEDQLLEGEESVEYISRLECMQVAIGEHLSQLNVLHPNRKLVLMTFSKEIKVYQPVMTEEGIAVEENTVRGDKLLKEPELNAFAQKLFDSNFNKLANVEQSYATIMKLVNGLSENGATALGPALLIAQRLCALYASQTKSEIILCTDGLSNIGVGSLEANPESEFYAEIGKKALEHRSVISIMSIEGTNCAMQSLGKCAEITGGRVNILNPFELVAEIQRIAQNPVVGEKAVVQVHTLPYFTVDEFDDSGNGSWKFEMGNIMKSSDLLLNFIQTKPVKLKQLPVQVQVTYRASDSSKRILVFADVVETTNDIEEAETGCDISIIGQFAVHKAAVLGQQQKYDDGIKLLYSVHHMLKRIAVEPSQQEEYHAFIDPAVVAQEELCSCINDPTRIESDDHSKILLNAKVIGADLFLAGTRKDVAAREDGVFSNEKLRSAYYEKRF